MQDIILWEMSPDPRGQYRIRKWGSENPRFAVEKRGFKGYKHIVSLESYDEAVQEIQDRLNKTILRYPQDENKEEVVLYFLLLEQAKK